ncbi:hypothetical protein S245_034126, partial [Arachis hypogaea]
ANDDDEAEQNHPLHQSKKSLHSFVYVSLKLCLVRLCSLPKCLTVSKIVSACLFKVLRILNDDMVMDT